MGLDPCDVQGILERDRLLTGCMPLLACGLQCADHWPPGRLVIHLATHKPAEHTIWAWHRAVTQLSIAHTLDPTVAACAYRPSAQPTRRCVSSRPFASANAPCTEARNTMLAYHAIASTYNGIQKMVPQESRLALPPALW